MLTEPNKYQTTYNKRIRMRIQERKLSYMFFAMEVLMQLRNSGGGYIRRYMSPWIFNIDL